MLDKARERNAHAALIESEALAYLEAVTEPFDLIVALDLLIYFGDLGAMFAAVADRLAPGGVFACSYETTTSAGFALKACGRFSHHPAYVAAIYAPRRRLLARQATTLRIEANRPVAGELLVLQRV
jgi:predicted TPR repeat methyltransferase